MGTILNKCVLASTDGSTYAKYTFKSQKLSIGVYDSSTCSNKIDKGSATLPSTCTLDKSTGAYTKGGIVSDPSTLALTASGSAAWGIWSNSDACVAGNPTVSTVVELGSALTGNCIGGVPVFNGMDGKITSCTVSNGVSTVTWDIFSSTNGKCKTKVGSQSFSNDADTCDNAFTSIYGIGYGYLNFSCQP